LAFWSFRIMAGIGFLLVLLAFLAVLWRNSIEKKKWFLKALLPCIALPYLATTFGWIITEESRQPWIVYGLLRVQDAASPNVTSGMIIFSLVLLTIVINALTLITGTLLYKYGTAAPKENTSETH